MAEHELFTNNSNKARAKAEQEKADLPELPHAKKPIAKRLKEDKKPSFGTKFRKQFLAEDVDSIGDYLVTDLIIPTIKDMVLNFMEAALWGNRRSGGLGRSSGGRAQQRSGYTDYSKASSITRMRSRDSRDSDRDRDRERRRRKEEHFDLLDNLLFQTRGEAEDVLSALEDYLDDYPFVTVSYLCELMDESGPFTTNYYGWKDLRGAQIYHYRNGYALELPDPIRTEENR